MPTADIEAAGGLTPAAGSATERDGGEAVSAGEEPAESSTVPSEESTDAKEPSADTTTQEKKAEGDAAPLAQAVAVTTPPASGDGAGDGMPPDRPKKPVLAGVAIGGAVVLAIPILLIGTGSHDGKKHRSAVAANTVMSGNGQPPPGAYTSTSPSVTPTPTPSAHAKHTPKVTKSAKPSAKPSAKNVAAAHHQGVPAGQRPLSGGNPYALEVHAPYDINVGKTLRTNRLALTMQSGGNLVLRDTSNKIIWSTGTHRAGSYAEFQTDGNLVVYFGGRQPVWASRTQGHQGATLVLQADYNLVIYNGHSAIWASGTNR